MNLQNLINYCRDFGLPDPFSGASVPAPLDVEMVKSAIMVRCGLLTPVFNDPITCTNMITQWFFEKQWTFEHLIKIVQAEYDPIENVFEERTEETEHGHTETRSGGYKDTEGGKDQRDITNSGTDTTTNTISAMNSSTYQPDNQSTTLHGHAIDDDVTYGRTSEREYKSDKMTHGGKDTVTIKRHGNVGITSADELIEQELKLLKHFDIYKYIAELFENDNMIMIY